MENQTTVVLDVTNFPTLEELEFQYIKLIMNKKFGNKAEIAKVLGLSVKTVYNKIDEYKKQGKLQPAEIT